MKKKRVLIHSNFCKMFTGFGKHKKNLLSYLYKTGKYELIELSNGFPWSEDKIQSVPWETYGALPDDPEELNEVVADEMRKHAAGYGAEVIDKAIKDLKPDIYLGIEDIWAFRTFFDKPWWNKIHCVVHTTLDSLPILSDAVEAADKIKNYFVWASFAEKALHKLGHTHVKTVRGSIETQHFFKLPEEQKFKLRDFFGLSDDFVIGFVFRNQLRKSAPNLLDGFKLFDEQHPEANAKLLLHTHWAEGWDIPKLIKEKEIDNNKVLTTYVCNNCGRYDIKPFIGQGAPCNFCGAPKGCATTNIQVGVNERQLNEIYNLMDVYCHPFTSGGQELPVQEAKLAELITLVTNYSCGEDACSEESGGLPLDWSEYREPGTQFIKATTSPISIRDRLSEVYEMSVSRRKEIGAQARQYVLDNYSIEIVGKFFEDLFDSLPEVDYNYQDEKIIHNIFYEPDDSLGDKEWVESLYENILQRVDSKGVEHWIARLNSDMNRAGVLNYFKKVALQEKNTQEFEEFIEEISEDPNKKRIAYIEPTGEQEILIASSILPSIKKQYPDHDIYFFTNMRHFSLIDSHPDVKRVMSYIPKFNNVFFLEGKGESEGYFDIVFAPYLSIRNNYFRNGLDKLQYNIHEHK